MSGKQISNGYSKKDLFTTLACLAVIAVFWFLPPLEPLTVIGMRTIGIFIGTVLLLSLVDTVWPVFLSLGLLTLTGGFSLNEVLAGSLGNWIITFVIASFVMTIALNKSGFTSRLTEYYMSRKFVSRSPWTFTFAFFSIAMLVGMFMDQVPATAFFLTFAGEILEKLGYDKKDKYSQVLTMGVVFAINIGGAATPISHSLVILGLGIYEKIAGQSIDLMTYMLYGIPVALVLFALLCLVVRYILKPDVDKFKNIDLHNIIGTRPPMEAKEKTVVTIFFTTVIFWILPGILGIFLSKEHLIMQTLSKFSITFFAMLAVILLAVIRINNKPLIDLKQTLEDKFPWGVILFISIGVLLGSAVSNEQVGLSAFIIAKLNPLLDSLPPVLLIALFAALTLCLTNFASNVTTITVMTGVAVTVALTNSSLNTAAIAITTTMCGSLAFVLPSSFAPIAMLHANENSKSSMVIKYGVLLCVLAVFVVTFLGYQIIDMLH